MTKDELIDECHEVANAVATLFKESRIWADHRKPSLARTLGRLHIKAEKVCELIEAQLPEEYLPEEQSDIEWWNEGVKRLESEEE